MKTLEAQRSDMLTCKKEIGLELCKCQNENARKDEAVRMLEANKSHLRSI